MTAHPRPVALHPSRYNQPAAGFAMPVPVERTDPASAYIAYVIGAGLHTIVTYEPAARVGVDPDGVHQLRSACRRLRCHLRHMRADLDAEWTEVMLRELRWLGATLGEVRDLEVMRDVLSACAASLPPIDVQHLEPLFAAVASEHAAAQTTLHEAFDSERYRAILAALTMASNHAPVIGEPTATAAEVARSTTRRAWNRLQRAVEHLGPTPSDADLHAVRLLAKRTRFASEAAVPLYGSPARKLAKAMANVQSVLGTQHDAVVAHHWVRERALHESPQVSFSAGMVAGLLRNASQQAAREFPTVWTKASREKLRSWL